MLASTYPVLSLFWSMLMFFGLILWIFLVITIFIDIFRSHDIGGFAKAMWVIFIVFLPDSWSAVLPDRAGWQHARAFGPRSDCRQGAIRRLRSHHRRSRFARGAAGHHCEPSRSGQAQRRGLREGESPNSRLKQQLRLRLAAVIAEAMISLEIE